MYISKELSDNTGSCFLTYVLDALCFISFCYYWVIEVEGQREWGISYLRESENHQKISLLALRI